MGATRTSYPRFRREGSAPRLELTDDDIAILRRVFRHRFIRAEDLYRLFPDRTPDRLSRRLAQLYRAQFLDRPLSQIDYFRGNGSRSLVYGLDTAGARFLAEKDGVSVGSGDWKSRNRTYTRDNLDHTLAVTRFLINLELACSSRPDVSFVPFEEIVAAAPPSTRKGTRPDRWAVSLRAATATASVHIVPDAVFGLRAVNADGRAAKSYAFLEIDRGTMTILPAMSVRESEAFLYRSTILRKLLAYAESYRRELHKEHLGIPSARVLTLTTSLARAEAMRETAFNLVTRPLRLPPALFLFGALEASDDPLATAWIDAAGEPTRLTPSPP